MQVMQKSLETFPDWVLAMTLVIAALLGWHGIDRMTLVVWGRLRLHFNKPDRRSPTPLEHVEEQDAVPQGSVADPYEPSR